MTESSNRWTVRALLTWTTDYLKKKGIESARLDAELLLAHALELRRLDLYIDPDRPLQPDELTRFKALVKQRSDQRRSMAHILGYKEFYAVRLATPPGVFVPRPETEELVEQCLTNLSHDSQARMLDLCSGSGAIPIAILHERAGIEAHAVEQSELAVEVARANAAQAGVENRLTVHHGDAVAFLDRCRPEFDLVTVNPPYIPSRDVDGLMPEVLEHEPRAALDGGVDGLDLFRKLVPRLPRALRSGGFVALEYDGSHQTAGLRQMLSDAGFQEISVHRDLAGHQRLIVAHLKASA